MTKLKFAEQIWQEIFSLGWFQQNLDIQSKKEIVIKKMLLWSI